MGSHRHLLSVDQLCIGQETALIIIKISYLEKGSTHEAHIVLMNIEDQTVMDRHCLGKLLARQFSIQGAISQYVVKCGICAIWILYLITFEMK